MNDFDKTNRMIKATKFINKAGERNFIEGLIYVHEYCRSNVTFNEGIMDNLSDSPQLCCVE